MLADITPLVLRGVIDNTTRDRIELQLWCARVAEPLCLVLQGNCLQDIAGCVVNFEQRSDVPKPPVSRTLQMLKILEKLQQAECAPIAGDITLSRRVLTAERPRRVLNFLSIEFFLGTETRFLIEGGQFNFNLSLPTWECSPACAAAQEMANMAALHDHVLAHVATFRGPALAHAGQGMPPCEWDAVLNRAEAFMTIAPSIHEKYSAHPRGKLAEAFVLDQSEFLAEAAEREEHGEMLYLGPGARSWEVLDFMEPAQADRVRKAMKHPLFNATVSLSGTLQHHILSDMQRYNSNREVEEMLSLYAMIITHVLGTILLSQGKRIPLETVMARADALCLRVEKMKRYTTPLPTRIRSMVLRGADVLLSELKSFVCTLPK